MNKIYIVLMNSDFNEGKGHMIIHKCFMNIDNARSYIKTQCGIMGSPQYCYSSIGTGRCNVELWNGYEIKEMKIED